ncbi:uncharacterized protein LOC122933224 [Bufo gargarizans]|uniref:uncharacterized protein LOC122933224 n=1 Tax=Bufo gargarizans TaxID=30331 RepID=UPI001CF2F6C2|nr:uncharacterized protein LOC122933224 [Bufo gargarizans]
MWYLAILVAFGASTVNGQFILLDCIPNLVSSNLQGGITASSFALQNPFCCIRQDNRIQLTDSAVLIVGLNTALLNLDPVSIDINNLLFSNFPKSGLFVAINGSIIDLCPLNINLPNAIFIGINLTCPINTNLVVCNGPLLQVGTYGVIIFVYRNRTLIATTRPSLDIVLKKPKDHHSIDTTINKHSASMIVITTVLPILLALSLVIFTTILLMKCCCCSIFTPTKCQQEQ